MTSMYHLIIAALLTAIAVLYQIECDSSRWNISEYANIPGSPENLSRFITNAEMVNKWFNWVSVFREADSRPISEGKKYQALYKIPVFGDYIMLFRLVDYKANRLYTLESESLLKPRFIIKLEPADDKITKVELSLEFRRNSALYHCTLGPLFWLLSSQQLRHSLFVLKMMFPF